MKSTSAMAIRGLMLDPARMTERHEFYFDLLPRLAEWGYNTLWWHFCDDEGFALKLKSHPELATPYALSKAQTRRLILAAREVGIDVVPEVESLGHALSITRLPRYAHLFDGHPFGHNAICPSHPDTLKLMTEIIQEVAELFDGPYMHAGLDEANLAGCKRCMRRGAGKPPWSVFARHALAVHKVIRSCGKRMIMWADPVEKNPDLLNVLPKDVILAHWHYGHVPRERIVPSVKAGFEIICVPAISGVVVQPDAAALRNVDDMVSLAGQLSRRGCMGVVACWWESARNIRDTYPLAAAYAGQAMQTGKATDRISFTRRFAAEYFGLKDARAAKALWQVHELALRREELKFLMYDGPADVHEALKLAQAEGFGSRCDQAAKCVADLQAARGKVRKRLAEYDASVLAARVLLASLDNGLKLQEAYKTYCRAAGYAEYKAPVPQVAEMLDQVAGTLSAMQGPIDRLARDVGREWDRTRHRGDRKKDGTSPLVRQRGARAVLATLLRCSRFHRALVGGLRRAIASYRRGGPFPASV